MKQDMELGRKIMIELEQAPYNGSWILLSIDGYSESEVNYNVMLLAKANLIEAYKYETMDGTTWLPITLNPEGHDFLRAAKHETLWEKAKTLVQERGSVLTLEVLKVVLSQLALKQAGL